MALPIIVMIGGIAIRYATKKLAAQAVKNIGGKLVSNPSVAVIRKALSPRKALTNNPTLLDKIKSQIGISPKQSKSMPLVGRSDKNAGINVGKLERTASERRSQLKVGIPLALIAGKIGYEMGKDKDTKKTTTKSKTKTYAEMVKEDKAKGKAKVLERRNKKNGIAKKVTPPTKKSKPAEPPKKKPDSIKSIPANRTEKQTRGQVAKEKKKNGVTFKFIKKKPLTTDGRKLGDKKGKT